MAVTLNGTNGLTFNDGSSQATAATGFGFKNRIINGAMVIDQRNAGAAVTTGSSFPVDRFLVGFSTDGAFSAQQDTVAPAGFVNSLKFTTTTADASLSASQFALIRQNIEGLNVADFGWGTANAQPVTVSFWVRSTLTGTFSASLVNNNVDRSYIFTYTISAANTWEYKTATIPGDTTGTWLTTNGVGIRLEFSMGVGSDLQGTAGSWTATNDRATAASVSVIGTLNATWAVTGVQLEKGSTATSFDYRPYGTELALCQRYLPAFNSSSATSTIAGGYAYGPNQVNVVVPFLVQTRTPPTSISVSAASHIQWSSVASAAASAAVFNICSTTEGIITLTATATSGQGGVAFFNTASGQLLFNGCEL